MIVDGQVAGPPNNRIFRNAGPSPAPAVAQPVSPAAGIPNVPYVPPSYPSRHYDHHEHGYSFQTINGQYVNTGKRRKRDISEEKIADKGCKKELGMYTVDVKVEEKDRLN